MPVNPLEKIAAYRKKQGMKGRKAPAPVMSLTDPNAPMSTGLGPDGVLQTDNPVAMIGTNNGNRMIHEGETVANLGTGNPVVTPNPLTMMQPDFEQQRALAQIEDQTGMPGYQYGTDGETLIDQTTPPPTTLTAEQGAAQAAARAKSLAGRDAMRAQGAEVQTTTSQSNTNAANIQALTPPVDDTTNTTSTTPTGGGNPYSDIEDKYGVDPTKTMADFATGDNPYYDQVKSQAMNDVKAQNQESLMWGAGQMAADPSMTTGAQNSMQAQLISQQGANTAEMMGKLGAAENEKMFDATKLLMQEDTEQEQLHYDRAVEADEGWKNAQNDIDNRIAELMSHSETADMTHEQIMEYIASDPEIIRLQGEIARYDTTLGYTPQVTPLERGVRSYLGKNQNDAYGNLGLAIGNKINLQGDLNDALEDRDILREAGRALGYTSAYDPATGELRDDVVELITAQYETQTLSPITVGAKAVVENFPELWADGWNSLSDEQKPLLNEWLREQLDSKALTVVDGALEWADGQEGIVPWEDPDTMYGDWVTADGDRIVYENGEKGIINSEGDFVPYSAVSYELEDGSKVSGQDFEDYWDALPSNMRLKFNKEDGITQEELAEIIKYGQDYDINSPQGDDNANPFYDGDTLKLDQDTIDAWKDAYDGGGILLSEINATEGDPVFIPHDLENFSDTDEIIGLPDSVLASQSTDYFFFYDGEGNKNAIQRADGDVEDMWYQASMMVDGESPMDTEDFADFLESGKYKWNGETFVKDDAAIAADPNATPEDQATFLSGITGTAPNELSDSAIAALENNPELANQYAAAAGDTTVTTGGGDARNANNRTTLDSATFKNGNYVVLGGKLYQVTSAISDLDDYKGWYGSNASALGRVSKSFGQQVQVTPVGGGTPINVYSVHRNDAMTGTNDADDREGKLPDGLFDNAILITSDGVGYNPYDVNGPKGTENDSKIQQGLGLLDQMFFGQGGSEEPIVAPLVDGVTPGNMVVEPTPNLGPGLIPGPSTNPNLRYS